MGAILTNKLEIPSLSLNSFDLRLSIASNSMYSVSSERRGATVKTMREGQREKKRLGRRKGETRGGWDFIEAVATRFVLFSRRCRGRRRGNTHGGREQRRWWGATRGGQLRRRASGDRALKGPTPHAPSSCQLSFFFSLLLPLLLSFSPSPSSSLPFCASGANVPFKFLLASFHTSLLSFLIPPPPRSLAFSYLDELHRVSRVFSVSTFNLVALSGRSSSHGPPPPPPSPLVVAVAADQPPRIVTLGPRVLSHGGEYRVSS